MCLYVIAVGARDGLNNSYCLIISDVNCGDPGKVTNGKVTLASNATYYGALALYACEPNFELDGVSRRLCLENGTWSLDAPVCRGTSSLQYFLIIRHH